MTDNLKLLPEDWVYRNIICHFDYWDGALSGLCKFNIFKIQDEIELKEKYLCFKYNGYVSDYKIIHKEEGYWAKSIEVRNFDYEVFDISKNQKDYLKDLELMHPHQFYKYNKEKRKRLSGNYKDSKMNYEDFKDKWKDVDLKWPELIKREDSAEA